MSDNPSSNRDARPHKGNPYKARGGNGGATPRQFERRDGAGPRGSSSEQRRPGRPEYRDGGGRAAESLDRRGGVRSGGFDPERDRPERLRHPGQEPAADEPATPVDFDESALPMGVKAELKGLSKELADVVGAHVLAAGELIDTDPELAYRHAEAARRRAGRIPIVREAAAETAYAAGHYDVALREFRALRRMNGGDDYLPVMADCERALGRHRDALELLASLDPKTKNLALRIECLLVEVGIRDDLGQHGEALRLLQSAISRKIGPKQGQARLRYAYAERLLDAGKTEDARAWFEAAEKLDAEGLLDSTERIALIDGVTLPEDMTLGAWDEVPEDDAQ